MTAMPDQATLVQMLQGYREANSQNLVQNLSPQDSEYENGYSEALDDALTELEQSVSSASRLITLNRATAVDLSAFERGYSFALADVEHLISTGSLPGQGAPQA
jgi:hypothetical protein